jgi:hypothetical protein
VVISLPKRILNHKEETMKKAIKLVTAVIIFCALALPASVNANDCEYLYIFLPKTRHYYFSAASTSHGLVSSVEPHRVILKQTLLEGGPAGHIEVSVDGSLISRFKVHQEYCFLKSGEITLTPTMGDKPIYTITRGSWSDNRGGEITITGFGDW